jgi:hypothetical protein
MGAAGHVFASMVNRGATMSRPSLRKLALPWIVFFAAAIVFTHSALEGGNRRGERAVCAVAAWAVALLLPLDAFCFQRFNRGTRGIVLGGFCILLSLFVGLGFALIGSNNALFGIPLGLIALYMLIRGIWLRRQTGGVGSSDRVED